MNLGLRAILYTVRKWKKTLLVFCLILSISTLVLSRLAIADAQEEQTEKVRGNHWSQLHRPERHIYRWLVKRKRRFLQHTGIYDRGHDSGDCLGGRHPGI